MGRRVDLKQASKAIEEGEDEVARKILVRHLKGRPSDDAAWVLMAAAVDTMEDRSECLKEALKHNPRNRVAKAALNKILQLDDAYAASRGPTWPSIVTALIPQVVILVVGLALIGWLVSWHLEESSYDMEGQVIHASVRDLRKYQRIGGGRSKCEADYVFRVGDETYSGTDTFYCPEWDTVSSTRRIRVEYLQSDPSSHRCYYSDDVFLPTPYITAALGAVVTIIGMIRLVAVVSQIRG